MIPFLVGAIISLFLLPAHTGRFFAWNIKAHMSAFLLASTYAGGLYYFVRLLVDGRWHRIAAGLPAIWAFVTVEGIATILHWGKFSHGNPIFWGWSALYFVTPFVIPVLWVRNRRADPGTPEPFDAPLPLAVRVGFGAAGAAQVAIGVFLLVFASTAIRHWAWPLTPLTAQTSSGWFALGVGGLFVARESRWSGARVLVESLFIALVVLGIGLVRGRGELDTGRVATWLFAVGLPVAAVGLAALHMIMQRARRASYEEPASSAR